MQYSACMNARDKRGLLVAIGASVKQLRLKRGLTMRELAARAEMSLRFQAQLESGTANISVGRLAGIAEALGVDLAELLPSRSREKRHLALLGLRGAGKSTIGRMASEAVGVPFVELDERIERSAGMGLAEIFALHGEGYYRRLEERCLEEVVRAGEAQIVALPGGIVGNERAYAMVRQRCVTAWLRANPEEHMRRVLRQGDPRPMADRPDAMAELRELLRARQPLYAQADIVIETAGKRRHSTLRSLLAALDRRGWRGRG